MSIISSLIQVFTDAELTQQLGSTVTTLGDDEVIILSDETLDLEDAFTPGEEYWCIALIENDSHILSEWTEPYHFITLGESDAIIQADEYPRLVYSYFANPDLLSLTQWGVKLSESEDGEDAYSITYFSVIEGGESRTDNLTGLKEHTEYFYIPFYRDNLGRWWEGKWEEANSFTTYYAAPTVYIDSIQTSTNSITVNAVTSSGNNPNIGNTYVRVDGKSVLACSGVDGSFTYTVTDGDISTGGSTIEILPNTEYEVAVLFYTDETLRIATTTIRTQAETELEVLLTIENVTSSSIRFSLYVGGTAELGLVECSYKKQGSNWVNLQCETDYGYQTFLLPVTASSNYTIQAYAEDAEGEIGASYTLSVATPAITGMTLDWYSTTRSGTNYIVVYDYTSANEAASATLQCNGGTVNGVIDDLNNTITFTVSGLFPSTTYLTTATLTDIYQNSITEAGSITTEPDSSTLTIDIVDSGRNSVDIELAYSLSTAFLSGVVEYWGEDDDPDTDQPLGSVPFIDGTTLVTVDNLATQTTYQFRATINMLGNLSVESEVETATTVDFYLTQYFTITNVSNQNNDIDCYSYLGDAATTLYYSLDDGDTWNSYAATTTQTTIATLAPDEHMLLKHTGALGVSSTDSRLQFRPTEPIEMSGNIASLTHGDSFYTGSALVMPADAFYKVFDNTNVVSAEHLTFGSYAAISTQGCRGMFYGCSNLTIGPDMSTITSVGGQGCYDMFHGCSSLVTPPDISGVRTFADGDRHHMRSMFYDCSSLTVAPVLQPVSGGWGFCFYEMFRNCTALTDASNIDFSNYTDGQQDTCNSMFYNCSSLVTPPPYTPNVTGGWGNMKYMFYNCTSLTSTPICRVTYSRDTTFSYMFQGCTSLTEGMDITNVTEDRAGVQGMYYGCTNLEIAYVPTILNGMTSAEATNWLYNCAAEGTVYADASVIYSVPSPSTYGCPSGWNLSIIPN